MTKLLHIEAPYAKKMVYSTTVSLLRSSTAIWYNHASKKLRSVPRRFAAQVCAGLRQLAGVEMGGGIQVGTPGLQLRLTSKRFLQGKHWFNDKLKTRCIALLVVHEKCMGFKE
eukprot:GHVU01147947.1.p2 GENE.GHVU01147947.1~~GHVU01147947.1.p2  ORF type:complete len:113 (+),score=9.23 GHVU01147947.1:138-476(+)